LAFFIAASHVVHNTHTHTLGGLFYSVYLLLRVQTEIDNKGIDKERVEKIEKACQVVIHEKENYRSVRDTNTVCIRYPDKHNLLLRVQPKIDNEGRGKERVEKEEKTCQAVIYEKNFF